MWIHESSRWMSGAFLALLIATPHLAAPPDARAEELVWERVYKGDPGSTTFGGGLAVDEDGGIYLAGSTQPVGQPFHADMLPVKYNSFGSRLWSRSYGGAEQQDNAHDVAVGSDGGVYVIGVNHLDRTYKWGCPLLKYSRDGALEWERRYQSPYAGGGATATASPPPPTAASISSASWTPRPAAAMRATICCS